MNEIASFIVQFTICNIRQLQGIAYTMEMVEKMWGNSLWLPHEGDFLIRIINH